MGSALSRGHEWDPRCRPRVSGNPCPTLERSAPSATNSATAPSRSSVIRTVGERRPGHPARYTVEPTSGGSGCAGVVRSVPWPMWTCRPPHGKLRLVGGSFVERCWAFRARPTHGRPASVPDTRIVRRSHNTSVTRRFPRHLPWRGRLGICRASLWVGAVMADSTVVLRSTNRILVGPNRGKLSPT